MGYWKTKVVPQVKKLFGPSGKKAAAVEFSKAFDGSKEEINKEFEEKKSELQPKVLEIYEASPANIKTLVKERKTSAVKKHPAEVTKFLEELVKIDFPGSKQVSEVIEKTGPALVSGPIFFLFEKVATFLPAEETPKEAPVAEPAPVAAVEEATREVVVEEEKKKGEEEEKEEIKEKVEASTSTDAPTGTDPPPTQPPAEPAAEPAKSEEPPKP
ncbi:plasma membrane-associated cation-binding protein 1-like [Typha angustifolia]|uniref:plasma membrane-associated cation-binding protein 1-like n=1 Tax=Typha angustifolia TaxID=59011 RepID=UPI003C2B80CC